MTTGVVRTGLLSMVGLIALGGTRVVHGILVGRAAGPDVYGTVSELIGLAMAASLFFPSGLANAASRYIAFHLGARDLDTARRAYRVLTAAGYACAVLLGVVVAVIASLLPDVDRGQAVAVGALTAIYSAYSVAKGALYGFDRIQPYTWLEIAGSVVALLATVAVVASGSHQYLLPLTVGYAVLMLGALVVLRERQPTGPGAALDVKELASWVGWASLGGGASAGLLQLLPVLAGRFTTGHEVGYFGAAVTLVSPLFFLPRALSLALFPALARAYGAGDVDVVRRHVDISTRALLALLAPIFAVGILIAPEVVVIFGAKFAGGAWLLQLLLVATFIGSIQVAAVNSLSSGNGLRITVYASVGGAILGLLALAPLGHSLGAAGVALAYLIAVVVTAAVPLVVVWRRYRLPWAGPCVRSALVVLVALAAAAVVSGASQPGLTRTLADVIVAIVVAGAGTLLLRGDIREVLSQRSASA
jgi:O-antigen/teichoic acid export membrane protein